MVKMATSRQVEKFLSTLIWRWKNLRRISGGVRQVDGVIFKCVIGGRRRCDDAVRGGRRRARKGIEGIGMVRVRGAGEVKI